MRRTRLRGFVALGTAIVNALLMGCQQREGIETTRRPVEVRIAAPTNATDMEVFIEKLIHVQSNVVHMANQNVLPGVDATSKGKRRLRVIKIGEGMLREGSEWIPVEIKSSITNLDNMYVAYVTLTNKCLVYVLSGHGPTHVVSYCESTNMATHLGRMWTLDITR